MILRWLVFAGSLAYIVLFAVLVCLRVRYPFELEWLEGGSIDHVRTILSGRPLYAAPGLTFIPLTYSPGYFYLGAVLMKIVGVGFVPLRLISIASSAGVLVLLARLAIRETGDWHAGMVAMGLFAAMYGWTDGWLDVARTDPLFLLLALASVYVLRTRSSTKATMLAAVLICLSFLVKQTGVIVAIPLCAWCAWRGWRPFVAFAGTVLVIIGGSTMALNRAFHGWYDYYVFAVPSHHQIATESILGFWRYDFIRPMPIAVTAGGAYLLWQVVGQKSERGVFYLLAAAGLVGGAYASRLHSLSYVNVVLPAYLIAALVFAIAVYDPSPGRNDARLKIVLYALCAVQLLRLAYNPAALVPTSADVLAGREFVERISAMPGDVFVVDHGYLPSLAGKPMHAHAAVIADVIRGGKTSVEQGLAGMLQGALARHQFDSIVIRDEPSPIRAWLPLDKYYRPAEHVVSVTSRFWHPETRYVPR